MTNTNFSTIVEQTANRMFKTTSNDSEHYILYNDGNANDLPLTENPFYFKHSKNLGQNKFVVGFGEGEWSYDISFQSTFCRYTNVENIGVEYKDMVTIYLP